jgi:predicted dehydrogenase
MTLFNPAYEAAKRAVDAGLLGEIVFVRGRHSYAIPPDRISRAAAWRLDTVQGGGPLMDVALYPAISLRDLTGQRVKRLAATGTTRVLRGQTEWDSVVFTFLLEDGTPGVIEGCFTHGASLIELEGTRGRLVLSGHISQACTGHLELLICQPGQRLVGERVTHDVVPDGVPHFLTYQRELEHISWCISTGEEPRAAGSGAVAELVVADAVRESIRTGRRVDLAW